MSLRIKDHTIIMIEKPAFNIFEVLEKDDKELIHSAFFKFLMQHDTTFYTKFLLLNGEYNTPRLEKGYGGKRGHKTRFDIEVESMDLKELIVIENKFKSFPDVGQLRSYDAILKKHHKKRIHHKYLICFDKEVVTPVEGWVIMDYKDVMQFIGKYYNLKGTDDKSVFMRHYYFLLGSYFEKYKQFKADMRPLFADAKDRHNNFWLKLFYHALKQKLDDFFFSRGIAAQVYVNKGNTLTPLLNITPKSWERGGRSLLVQFQGDEIKFYSNSDDRDFLTGLISFSQQCFPPGTYSYKKLTQKHSNTYFILKTTVRKELPGGLITLNSLYELLTDFYLILDREVMINQ